jgi:hypothetical protein
MGETFGDVQGNVIGFNRRSDKRRRDFSAIRGRDVLDKLLQSNPDDADALRLAHELLAEEANYASAMHMAASTLRAGQIRVFISYRLDSDTELARAVAAAFRELSGGRVAVTLAADFTRDISGRDYKEVIGKEITRAHWFVLLLSNLGQNNDWCMYETGMFRASMVSNRINRLICIHHPQTRLPGPIQEFQSVPAESDRLHAFFQGLFLTSHPIPGWSALNDQVSEESMRAHADRVVQLMRGPSRPVNFNYRVTLEVTRPADDHTAADLDSCSIDTDTRTADLFGKVDPPTTWGELIMNVRRGGRQDQWLTELHAVICKACSNNTFRPISGTFESSHGGRIMRPIVESMVHEDGSDHYCVRLIFVEDLYSASIPAVTPEVLAFLSALRTHSRLRWELIERFSDVNWDKDQADACAQVFSRIERAGQSFTQWDLNALCANYAEPVGERIRAIMTRWRELRRSGPAAAQLGPGILDLALRRCDGEAIKPLIEECAGLVNDFLRLSYPVMENINESD